MKQWVKKFLQQFEGSREAGSVNSEIDLNLSEDRATLLYIIDAYSKHLIEVEGRPVRKVREIFDEFAKALLKPENTLTEKVLFRFRQFFSAYRTEEYSYLQKTFEDFKGIIWDFADQLNESVQAEQARDQEVRKSLDHLREAVEANSIGELKSKSREFIDFYIELQSRNEERRTAQLSNVQNNLASVKKKLIEVHQSARRDHLTGAYNRKCFDEAAPHWMKAFNAHAVPVTLVALDIDYFKKINDIFGHDTGDVVLKEFVRILKEQFPGEKDFVARIGGEEFIVALPGHDLASAAHLTESALKRIRNEVIVHADTQIRFTVSAGIAQLTTGETLEHWLKRADNALYASKNNGRDQFTLAPAQSANVA